MLELCEQCFESRPKGEVTPQKISQLFNVQDPFELVKDIPHINEVKMKNASFHLYRRTHHVLTEAKRVYDFANTCAD